MITLIEALNYRCLRYVRQPLGNFHLLVGPNASGKTTFFDIIAFLGRLVKDGLDAAKKERARSYGDLIWNRQGSEGSGFELAVEARIPDDISKEIEKGKYDTIRYEVSVKLVSSAEDDAEFVEKVFLKKTGKKDQSKPSRTQGKKKFPAPPAVIPQTILSNDDNPSNQKLIIDRMDSGNARGNLEIASKSGDEQFQLELDKQESAFNKFVEDEMRNPATSWLKRFLEKGIQPIILDSLKMRQTLPPSPRREQELTFNTDGSNLPWLVDELRNKHKERFREWIEHLQTELEDLEDIKTVKDPNTGECQIIICYRNGLEVPSWTTSDGTLRLLALTLIAYIPGLTGIYLVEEPENGIHPSGIETIYQSLSWVYDAQILLATHSPLVVTLVEPSEILCFAKTPAGETDIVPGNEHPILKSWKGGVDLGTLFASGVFA